MIRFKENESNTPKAVLQREKIEIERTSLASCASQTTSLIVPIYRTVEAVVGIANRIVGLLQKRKHHPISRFSVATLSPLSLAYYCRRGGVAIEHLIRIAIRPASSANKFLIATTPTKPMQRMRRLSIHHSTQLLPLHHPFQCSSIDPTAFSTDLIASQLRRTRRERS